MARTLYLGLLKNRLGREAKIAFFDHLNYRFSFGVEYQSCSMINYLSAVKIWVHFDEQSASYGFSCDEQRCCPYCYHTRSSSTLPRLPFGTLGKSYITILMKEFAVPDGCSSSHHCHPTSRNIWPPKPSYSVNSSRDNNNNNNNNNGVDPMFINLKLLVTRNSWQLSPLCSTRRKSHWMRMLGSA